jgi:hypothetical protein
MSHLESLLKQAKKLYSETRGAYFVITGSNCGEYWFLKMPSIGETFESVHLETVLEDYIDLVINNRVKVAKRKNTTKEFRL